MDHTTNLHRSRTIRCSVLSGYNRPSVGPRMRYLLDKTGPIGPGYNRPFVGPWQNRPCRSSTQLTICWSWFKQTVLELLTTEPAGSDMQRNGTSTVVTRQSWTLSYVQGVTHADECWTAVSLCPSLFSGLSSSLPTVSLSNALVSLLVSISRLVSALVSSSLSLQFALKSLH